MSFKRFLLALNAAVIFFVVVYLYATGGPIPGGQFPEEGTLLFEEKKLGTLFSAFQISMIGLIALLNAALALTQNRQHEIFFWTLSFFGFIFLAFDEYFLIHENIDRWIIRTFNLPHNRLTDRFDDILILIYGLIGLYVVKTSWHWLKKYPRFLPHLRVGFILLFLMFLFDIAHIKMTPVKELEEDAFKLFGAAYFLLAYFFCLKKPPIPTV